jgi:hypothetical protein
VAATAAAASMPSTSPVARLVLAAAALSAITALIEDLRVVPPVAAIGYLLFNGFLVNRSGVLTWNPTSRWQLAVFVVAAAVGIGLRYVRRLRAKALLDDELRRLIGNSRPTITKRPRRG